ncbi:dehydrogenase [Thermoflavifilum sp.]|jgi:D-glycero-alpha-D-manno-heptose-7-phosphate kinase|uniref:GHMP family kinase ATP-binding protein n=1 Tax=Thermoflavifilum sp. TaxID=1968839 RepID=UPI0025FAD61B|nr:dehydrogenase [Thermoflavifilum sp.]
MMIHRSKAPLRIGLAGGGTDVSPYADLYHGAVLNATLSLFAYASIEPLRESRIELHAVDRGQYLLLPAEPEHPADGELLLLKGVYNRIVKDFTHQPLSFRLTTYVDAPPGSGLGTSSTLVVAVVGAFAEWLKLPLGEYDIARLAYEIERHDLGMAGGRQDQYAATFGGVNFMEFFADEKVIVNPLRIRQHYLDELENNLLLYYTATSRISSLIIEEQRKNVIQKNTSSIEAMHQLKEQAILMKEALLKGRIDEIGEILDFGFQHKRRMASGISNPQLDEIYETAKKAGATGGKISGAGGGGFMILYCPGNTRYRVMEALKVFGGSFHKYQFVQQGLTTWSM